MVLFMSRPWKHPKTGVYYYRKVVPEAMRALVGKVEVRQTLGTKTPREAALRHVEVAAKVAAEWEALGRGPEPLTLKEAVALAGEAYRDFQVLEEDPGKAETWHRMLLTNAKARSGSPSLMIGEEARQRDAMEQLHGKLADHYLGKRGVLTDGEGRWKFIKALSDALEDAFLKLARNAEGDYSPDPAAEKRPKWTPGANPSAPRSGTAGFSISAILEGWTKEARATGRKPSTIESYSNTVAGLVAFLGHDDGKLVTPEEIVRFKDHRLSSINRRTGKPISAKIVKDSDLSGLKTLFGWAVSNRKLTANPVTGISIKLGKPQKLRSKGLTEDEARAILTASLKVTRGGESAGTFAAKRWVPWLAAYTGARVGELAQLRKQDVTREGEHWTIRLTPEAGTIKTNEARTVVLHPHLVELGFPAFVEAAPAGHLFLKPSKSGDVLGPLQGLKNRLAEFSRAIVKDPNVAPMHGFRHRFKTVGMEAGVSTRILDAIQGHAPRNAGDSYGDVTVRAMATAIAKIPRAEADGWG